MSETFYAKGLALEAGKTLKSFPLKGVDIQPCWREVGYVRACSDKSGGLTIGVVEFHLQDGRSCIRTYVEFQGVLTWFYDLSFPSKGEGVISVKASVDSRNFEGSDCMRWLAHWGRGRISVDLAMRDGSELGTRIFVDEKGIYPRLEEMFVWLDNSLFRGEECMVYAPDALDLQSPFDETLAFALDARVEQSGYLNKVLLAKKYLL